ncbi:MAG TPA: hypothetical protein VKA58_07590, partial [Propionibacteriaceae bacterium]|nr:hypothetical protein [Propionibacteriaceae bacterium]
MHLSMSRNVRQDVDHRSAGLAGHEPPHTPVLVVRELASPESSPNQNGELEASAFSSGTCVRIPLYADRRFRVGHPDVDVLAADGGAEHALQRVLD